MTRTDRVQFLNLQFDSLTFSEVKDRLRAASASTSYAYVVTPNVDHVVRLEREPEFRHLYETAELCLCDSRILRLLARLSGIDLSLVAGSDLSASLFEEVIQAGDRVAVVGATRDFLDRLRARYSDVEFLHHAPPMGLRKNAEARREAATFLAKSKPRFGFITVGSPQQEMIAHEAGQYLDATGITLCVGAGLEFLTGDQRRAPRGVQRMGLEWAHRLASDPRRLWRRYLLEGPQIFLIYLRWAFRARQKWCAAGLAVLAAIGLAVALLGTGHSSGASSAGRARRAEARLPPAEMQPLNLPPPDLLHPLSPEEAAKANAERPFAKRPDTAAAKFVLKAPADDRERALTCLTQAVYYEAAGEGADGERAVAQVVINRVHHPGFPASVCGVVYQGAGRGTGCQFTFTCDGSLRRIPAPASWDRARKIAQDALSGKVFSAIGHATHYHADSVLPYWADSLDKTVQLGRHIFYRLRSTLGDHTAFVQRYAGFEPVVKQPNATVILPPTAATQQLTGALLSDTLNGKLPEVEKVGQPAASPLAADLDRGSLIIDSQSSTQLARREQKPSADCKTSAQNERLSAVAKTDLLTDKAASCSSN